MAVWGLHECSVRPGALEHCADLTANRCHADSMEAHADRGGLRTPLNRHCRVGEWFDTTGCTSTAAASPGSGRGRLLRSPVGVGGADAMVVEVERDHRGVDAGLQQGHGASATSTCACTRLLDGDGYRAAVAGRVSTPNESEGHGRAQIAEVPITENLGPGHGRGAKWTKRWWAAREGSPDSPGTHGAEVDTVSNSLAPVVPPRSLSRGAVAPSFRRWLW